MGKEGKMNTFNLKRLGGGLLGLPTAKPTTPWGYQGRERARRRLERLWKKGRRKGGRGSSEGKAKWVKRVEMLGHLKANSGPNARVPAQILCDVLCQIEPWPTDGSSTWVRGGLN